MKRLVVVPVFGLAVLLGLTTGAHAQFAAGAPSPMPAPYAPPETDANGVPIAAPGQMQAPAPAQMVDGQPVYEQPAPGELPLPADEAGAGSPEQPQLQPYDPNNAGNVPPVDLGPDNEIAQSYDDGYDSQAYTQFQSALSPYGAWDYDSSYGYVWCPSAALVGAGFVPYSTGGRWALSEFGWTWVSDWNWGWAPFHYGRWVTRAGRGWSWVPGTMWGPAWVSWRSGNGYVGWAPLPPRGVHLASALGAGSPWRFTSAANLGAARPAFIARRDLPGMFARTSVVSNDRLLSHGRWNVHINAGPSRGIVVQPVSLSSVAPRVFPRVAIYPHSGMALNERPWIRAQAARNDALTPGWHAGMPTPGRTEGRTPAYTPGPSVQPQARASVSNWSHPVPAYGGYARPSANAWSSGVRPAYGTSVNYSTAAAPRAAAPTSAPVYRTAAPTSAPVYRAAPAYGPAYRTPAPAYGPAYRTAAPTYAPAYHPAAPTYVPSGPRGEVGGGFNRGPAPEVGGASHFGGGSSGGGHASGGARRR